ncbi:non-ribosomal peptide synthetase [Fusarium coicis]|nr:non-ribosomal peptide synthetase [Fusarium coicis]
MISQLDNLLKSLTTVDPDTGLRKVTEKMLEVDQQYGISNVKSSQLDSSRKGPQNLVEAIENSIKAHPNLYERYMQGAIDLDFVTNYFEGVQLQHKGILKVVAQPEGKLYSRPGQRNAQMLSLGFDSCIKEVFSTICFGATLVLKDPDNPIAHLTKVDATMATPSLLATLEPDDYPNLKAITVAGEAASQVTPGYYCNEKETASRFLSDPLSPGQTMFRTGDIGRMLEDGNIEYIGREDDQIKLRGFRIDLGEVQSTISKLATEAKNVALVVSNGNMLAFVTPDNIDVESLTKSLELHLPQYAVPHRIIALAKLPTSANNKVDSFALRKYAEDQGTSGVAVEEPETDTQRSLATIWADVLKRDLNQIPIGPSDRFFELGGHSLLQIKVAQAISKHWDIRPLPLEHVIRHHSLRDLSFAIDDLSSPVPRDGPLPISFLEKEMFLNHLISGGSPAGNMNFVFSVRGNLNAGVLADAFQRVTVDIEAPPTVHIPCVVQTGNLNSFVHQKITRFFNLSTEPPLDVSIIIGNPVQIMLVIVMSHVVGDAVTMSTYLNRVSQTYHLLTSTVSKAKMTTTPDALTYIDWAQWAAALEHDPGALAFCSSYLSNPPSPLTFGNLSPGAVTYMGFTRSWTLPSSMHHSLSKLAEKSSVTMHQLILGAVFISLQCVDRRDDILLAAPFIHRSEPGTESIPGLFLDRLLLRIQRRSGQNSLFSFLSSIRETSQQALAHIVPYQSLRSHLAHKPSLLNPLFQVMVAYHIAAEQQPLLELQGAEVQAIPCRETGGSKFPLKVEFTETTVEDVQVDMEYDMGCISEDIAMRLEFALSFTLQLMVTERDVGNIIQLVEMSFRPDTEHGQQESVSRMSPSAEVIVSVPTHLGGINGDYPVKTHKKLSNGHFNAEESLALGRLTPYDVLTSALPLPAPVSATEF